MQIRNRTDPKPSTIKGKPILYGHHLCPFVERVRIALKLLDLYDHVTHCQIDLTKRPKWYRQLNPSRKVPTLQFADGRVVYQSDIVVDLIDYIARKQNPLSSNLLYPEDGVDRAQLKLMISKYTQFIKHFYDVLSGKVQMQELGGVMTKALDQIENDLKRNTGKKYLNGADHMTALDVFVYPHLIRLLWFKDSVFKALYKQYDGDKFEHCKAYCDRIYSDQKLKDALTIKSGFLYQMQDFVKNGRMMLKLPVKL